MSSKSENTLFSTKLLNFFKFRKLQKIPQIYLFLLYFIIVVLINESNLTKHIAANSELYPKLLINFQKIFTYLSALLFIFFYRKNKTSNVYFYFLSLTIVFIIYASRYIQPYLFQDDYYHYMSIVRGNFIEALFIPFVDHVTPIWRLIQYLNIKVFGNYWSIATLPFFGAFVVAGSATTLKLLLDKLNIKHSWGYSLLLLVYPGYRSILFWISTNAIALGTIFGMGALFIFAKIEKANKAITSDLIKLFLCCLGAFYSWTTGLVFPISITVFAVANIFWAKIQKEELEKEKNFKLFIVCFLSLVSFAITRVLSFQIFTPEYVGKLLWLKNGLEHGYEKNLLRPFFWPFFSVSDGLILSGGFSITRALVDSFEILLSRGIIFFLLILVLSLRFKNKYLLYSYIFAFLSFAIVFVKRGIGPLSHPRPHGYVDYALSNDWYRISALGGVLFFAGIAMSNVKSEKLGKLLRWLSIVIMISFCSTSLKQSAGGHHFSARNEINSRLWKSASCIKELPWETSDYLYASANIYAPMRGSNPGGFWLNYEMSWFDMYAKRTYDSDIKFNTSRQNILMTDLNKYCQKLMADIDTFATPFSTDAYPEGGAISISPLEVSSQNNAVFLRNNETTDCPYGEAQILNIYFKEEALKDNLTTLSKIALKTDTQEYSFEIQPTTQAISFDLRILPSKLRCSRDLQFVIDKDKRNIQKAVAIKYLE